jgi:hypothetical protein
MSVKSKTRPMCRWCGRDLRKYTVTHWVVNNPSTYKSEPERYHAGPVQTSAEAKRIVNGEVTSISYFRPDHKGGIRTFNVWDGESYLATRGFFCTNECAMDMGAAACRQTTHGGPGYVRRIAELQQKATEAAR